ncbi:photosystem II protein Psb27 [Phormidesmis priestleyi ULC007]|uniref:Photosystem II lipoprotein Psb27 n=1 Tax=Phormidesmis priestleyi ULC007 TaxID=1920490 RepID=A0A2T1DHJ0_9CYAN|nr:photosystem II protein Psb27 [Phormidesmis priestleyi]PSB19914.1 photosystem II protein Psb27 [Phormidesmis priestleyi ULC007]PZO50388.1 MAG: photosystem II protein Psb27 [Phormidesmis priestleyi]
MKRFLSRILALVLVVAIGLTGCSSDSTTGLTGNYREDTLGVIGSLRSALELPADSPDKVAVRAEARKNINDFASRYQRDPAILKLNSFTTMRTALNSLAGHYSSYPNRPVPEKLKTRLEQEFKQVEVSLKRGV